VNVCEGKVSLEGEAAFTLYHPLRAGATPTVVNAVGEENIRNVSSLSLPLLLFSPTRSLNNRDYIHQIYLPQKPFFSKPIFHSGPSSQNIRYIHTYLPSLSAVSNNAP